MKIKFDIRKYILIFGLLFAIVLRLWNLSSNPPGLTPDEASLGYNSYSILKTGHDEWGNYLPVIFKSFGDYKPGAYVYFDLPFIAVFGLNEFSTRLPSAIAGVITVYLLFLICKKLFSNDKLAYIVLLVSATNPWLMYFSRGAWEANVSLCLTLAGIYFFLKAITENRHLVISAVFFGLTLITYQGAKFSTSIVLLILLVVYWSDFWKINKKYIYTSLFVGAFIALPIFLSFFIGQTNRLNIFSIFSYKRPSSEISIINEQDSVKAGGIEFALFHSEKLNYFRAIMGRYFNNFSGRFLFFEGDWANPISTAPYQGVLLISDIIFLPLGFLFLLKNKLSKSGWFLLLWCILAPFSTALSRDELNAVRDLNLAIPLIIIISFGISYFIEKFKAKGYVLAFAFSLLAFFYFVDAYFVHIPAHSSNLWRYGYKQAFEYVNQTKSNYSNVVFEQSFNQPYIYFLFYSPKSPLGYQLQQKMIDSEYKGDVGFVPSLGGIEFKPLDWQVLRREHNILVVASATNVPPEILGNPKDYPILKEIKYLNDRDIAFYIINIK